MLSRCRNPKDDSFPSYGGRGISVCRGWYNFLCFLSDMGRRPSPKHTLDRIDNNGNYEPGNVRWVATQKEQARNTRWNRKLTFNGVTKLVIEWAEETGLERCTIMRRLDRGWPPESVLRKPLHPKKRPLLDNLHVRLPNTEHLPHMQADIR